MPGSGPDPALPGTDPTGGLASVGSGQCREVLHQLGTHVDLPGNGAGTRVVLPDNDARKGIKGFSHCVALSVLVLVPMYVQSVAKGDVEVEHEVKIGGDDDEDAASHPSPNVKRFIPSRVRSMPRAPLGIVAKMVMAESGDATQSSEAKPTICNRAAS